MLWSYQRELRPLVIVYVCTHPEGVVVHALSSLLGTLWNVLYTTILKGPPLHHVIVLFCAEDLAPKPHLFSLVHLCNEGEVLVDHIDLLLGQCKASPLQFLMLIGKLAQNTSPFAGRHLNKRHRSVHALINRWLRLNTSLLDKVRHMYNILDILSPLNISK